MNGLKLTSIIVVVAVVSFLAGVSYRGQRSAGHNSANGRRILYYHDPMHPAYKSDKPGIAPDCGMNLEPVYEDGDTVITGERVAAGTVSISPENQQIVGVRIVPVATTPLSHTARLLGRVAADENRTYRLNSSVEGWVRRTENRVTGSLVGKDERLASFYSPEFYSAQQAYFYALGAIDRFRASGMDTPDQIKATNTQVQTSADSLRNLGMSDQQIAEIGKTRQIVQDIWVTSPVAGLVLARNISPGQRFEKGTEFYKITDLGHVWILADVFENDAQYFRPGTRALAKLPNKQKSFVATVSNEPPQFDPATRTLKLRLELDNPGYLLRPDMFVDVELPIHPPDGLTVPADAVVDSGRRTVVYVERGEGTFEPRAVEIGSRFDDRVAITRGLAPGERVVAGGNFLLDSESRLRLAAAQTPPAGEKDPVCGMDVKSGAHSTRIGGRTYRFCSAKCKQDFESNPEKYNKRGA